MQYESEGSNLNRDFFTAVSEGDMNLVNLLLDLGADVNAPFGEYDGTPLMEAVGDNRLRLTRLLLKRGASINATTICGDSALSIACCVGNAEIVWLLIKSGADIECRDKMWGGTVLMCAASRGHVAVLDLLLKAGVNIESKSTSGTTALHSASLWGQVETIRFLLDRGADLYARSDCHTPLALAALEGHLEAINFLLENGVDINEIAPDGATALTHALWGNQTDAVTLLRQRGAHE